MAARPAETRRLQSFLSDNASHNRRFDEFRKRLEPLRGTVPEGLADAITLDAVADLLRLTRRSGSSTGQRVHQETAYAHLVMAAMLLAKMTELAEHFERDAAVAERRPCGVGDTGRPRLGRPCGVGDYRTAASLSSRPSTTSGWTAVAHWPAPVDDAADAAASAGAAAHDDVAGVDVEPDVATAGLALRGDGDALRIKVKLADGSGHGDGTAGPACAHAR